MNEFLTSLFMQMRIGVMSTLFLDAR